MEYKENKDLKEFLDDTSAILEATREAIIDCRDAVSMRRLEDLTRQLCWSRYLAVVSDCWLSPDMVQLTMNKIWPSLGPNPNAFN